MTAPARRPHGRAPGGRGPGAEGIEGARGRDAGVEEPAAEGAGGRGPGAEADTGRMTEMVRVGAVELCAQAFGAPGDPAVLLIGGSGASMDWWESDFCRALADGGRYVVRYDHRDTGQSVHYPPGKPGYGHADLVADAVGVLDAYGLDTAHVVGISMGGGIAQLLTLEHPERVASLTVLSTSAGPGDPDLPPVAEGMRFPPPPDWSDPAAVLEHLVQAQRGLAARSVPLDEAEVRAVAGPALARTADLEASLTNHDALAGGDSWRSRLGEIAVPTLVLHGDEDPLFPPGHGAALAAEVPGGRLLLLPQTGHELPRRVWDTVLPAILAHTEQAGGAS